MDKRVTRLIKVLQRLRKDEKFNADGLAQTLGVSRRTVFRDLQTLRDAGIDVSMDLKQIGYRIAPSQRVAKSVASDDLYELLLCAAATQLPQSPEHRSMALRAIGTLADQLGESERKLVLQLLGHCQPSSHTSGYASCSQDRDKVNLLLTSIRNKQPVSLAIGENAAGIPAALAVYPLTVRPMEGKWTLDAVTIKNHLKLRVGLQHIRMVQAEPDLPYPKLGQHLLGWDQADHELL